MTAALWVNLHVEKPVSPLADGQLTITVGHMIYLLMWLTDFCLQIYSTKRPVLRVTGKTQITGKTAKIPERPKINRETLNR